MSGAVRQVQHPNGAIIIKTRRSNCQEADLFDNRTHGGLIHHVIPLFFSICRRAAVGCPTLTQIPESIKIEYIATTDSRVERWRAAVKCRGESGRTLEWRLRCSGTDWIVDEPESGKNHRVTAATYRELFRACSDRLISVNDETGYCAYNVR
jgi:hypothetical protein